MAVPHSNTMRQTLPSIRDIFSKEFFSSPPRPLYCYPPTPPLSRSPTPPDSPRPLTPIFVFENPATITTPTPSPPPLSTPSLIWMTPNTNTPCTSPPPPPPPPPPSFRLVATTSIETADAVIFIPSPQSSPKPEDSRALLLVGSAISRQLRQQAAEGKGSKGRMHPYRIVRNDVKRSKRSS